MKKAKLTKNEVKHIAKLANLPLTEKELQKFEKQLSETLDYIAILTKVKTDRILPTSQVTCLENVFREDNEESSLSLEDALSNVPKKHKSYIKAKAIFKDE